MKRSILAIAMTFAVACPAFAQSSGASPADPNNERNQNPAPSNTQPADPAANDNPNARVPTGVDDKEAADREQGGVTGERTGGPRPDETGSITTETPPPPANQ